MNRAASAYWVGVSVWKSDGTLIREDNVLVHYEENDFQTQIIFVNPVYVHSGQTLTIGPCFAEEIDDPGNRS